MTTTQNSTENKSTTP